VSSLVGAWWLPGSLAIAGVMIVLLLVLNVPVQLLSAQARFMVCHPVIPWHWLYYFYGGLAFAIGMSATSTSAALSRTIPATLGAV